MQAPKLNPFVLNHVPGVSVAVTCCSHPLDLQIPRSVFFMIFKFASSSATEFFFFLGKGNYSNAEFH